MTNTARSIVDTIVEEWRMQEDRVRKGFIPREQALPCLYERLHRHGIRNPHMRQFLDQVGYVPRIEDERMDLPWAPDPRVEQEEVFAA